MTAIDTSEELLTRIAGNLNEVTILLNKAVTDVVSNSINWHETIAAMRDEICQQVADLACKDIGGDREFVHAAVHKQIEMLFDEILGVIDIWALRVMRPETSSSGDRKLH